MKTTLTSFGSLLLVATIVVVSALCNPLHAQVFNPVNGHYYQRVDVPAGVDWFGADASALSSQYGGVSGHLASVTSQEENDFVVSNLGLLNTWIGGWQSAGAPTPDADWQWVTGESWSYTNWGPAEPDDGAGSEDGLQYGAGPYWIDAPRGWLQGSYLVEFPVGAELFHWNNSAGGDFHTAANWSANYVPAANEPAIFDLNSSGYTVTAAAEIATASLAVHNEDVSLDLGNHTWTLPHNNAHVMWVGKEVGEDGRLTLQSGTLVTGRTVIGNETDATGTLIVDGPNAHLSVIDSALFAGGTGNSEGAIEIRNGGRVSVTGTGETTLYIAPQPDTTGNVLVTGAGSELVSEQNIFVGERGEGFLNVVDGAFVSAPTIFSIGSRTAGPSPVASGFVRVDTGRMLETGQLQIGGGATGIGGKGALLIESGGIVTSSISGLATQNSATMGVFVPQAHGEARVTGAGSKWLQDGIFNVGSTGSALLEIDDQGYVNSVDAQVARDTSASAEVHIDGPGSHWAVDERLIFGGAFVAPGGAATIEVTNGGRITAGELLHLWSQGEIDLSGGGSIEVGAIDTPAAGVLQVGAGGTLSGTGTIIGDVLVDGGTVTPGASPGALHINGNFHQLPGNLLTMEIGGTTPGSEYDQLLVTGDLLLEGAVQIAFIDAFMPQVGDKFALFAASSAQLTGPLTFLNAPPNLQYSSSFENGVLSLTVVPEPGSLWLVCLAIVLVLLTGNRRSIQPHNA